MLTVLLGSMGKSIAHLYSLFTHHNDFTYLHLMTFPVVMTTPVQLKKKKEKKTKLISFEFSNLSYAPI